MMCTRCAGGVVYVWCCVHVVLCICGTMLRVLCSRCVTTCVFIVLYSVYVYVLCCTSVVGVCVVLYIECRLCHVVHSV